MSGPRIGVSVAGADAGEVARLAAIAENRNIDCLLVGSLDSGPPNSDDTYVLTAAAAASSRTRFLRIAVALDLRGSADPLRIAEDIGVLDVMSGGRLELVFRRQVDQRWAADLDAILRAWSGWDFPDGRTMPVTPAPIQPSVPAWVVEPSATAARVARPMGQAHSMLFVEWPGPSRLPDGSHVPDGASLRALRRMRYQALAATVVFDLGATPVGDRTDALAVLGTVVAPCLRCADEEVDILALDATDWLRRRTELHHPPLGDVELRST